jgi:hypothetical protein
MPHGGDANYSVIVSVSETCSITTYADSAFYDFHQVIGHWLDDGQKQLGC